MSIDFSLLPEVVWVKIFSYLSLSEKSRTARTCSQLYNVFNHPSVWHSAKIVLLGELTLTDDPRKHSAVMVPERYSMMITHFGRFFQDLSVIVIGYVFKLERASIDLLRQLAETCRVERLTLRIGNAIGKLDGTMRRPREEELCVLTAIIKTAFRLKSLVLESWPIFPGDEQCQALESIRKSDRMKELERLSLFHPPISEDAWISLNICLPSSEQVLLTIQFLTNLKYLSLQSSMLSLETVRELSRTGRRQLSYLGILVTYIKPNVGVSIQKISSEVWQKLVSVSTNLVVEVTFGNTVPSFELIDFLKPEIPIWAVNFMKYARYEPHILSHLAANYAGQLRKFVDFSDGCSKPAQLVSLVTHCTSLDQLVYNGRLQDTDILNIVDLRGNKWINFQVNTDNTVISYPSPTGVNFEDDVIGHAENGGYFLMSHLPAAEFYHTDDSEEFRRNTIDAIKDKVSTILHHKWNPLRNNKTEFS